MDKEIKRYWDNHSAQNATQILLFLFYIGMVF